MHLNIKKQKDFILISFAKNCNLNSGNVDHFKEHVMKHFQAKLPFILDLKKLEFIDSAGLTVLIHLRRKISESHGTLKLANPGERIQKMMQITRLHRVFDIYDTIDSAVRSIERKTKQSKAINPYQLHLQVRKSEDYFWAKIKQPDSLIKANTKQFRAKMAQYLEKAPTLIINFENIRNIDSAGIASLIHLKRLSRQKKKKIFLVYNNRVLTKLFKLYSLDDLFSQFQNDQEAISAVKPVKRKARQVTQSVQPKLKPAGVNLDLEFSDILFLTTTKEI